MTGVPAISPVARKRWRRFRRLRRAWFSLWLLLALYGLGLAANLLCNDKPLLVRCRGRWYAPFAQYVPEARLLDNGRQTRPNYKALAATPLFAAGSGNWILFPPHPWSPNEVVASEALQGHERVTVRLSPALHAATVNLAADGTIARSADAGFFFDRGDDAVNGLAFTNAWRLPPAAIEAVRLRLANRASPRAAFTAPHARDAARRVEIALSPYAPRASPPDSARLTLREPAPLGTDTARVVLEHDGRVAHGAPTWDRLPDALRTRLADLARQRFDGVVPPAAFAWNAGAWRATFEREDILWPFRPVAGHPLGIDYAGRDVLARLLYGLRTSMTFGLLLVVLSMALGVVLGALQGYFGGAVDLTGQRLTEIWSALPFLYVMILLGAVFGRSFGLLLGVYAMFHWIGLSYYVRAEFLRLRHQAFVEAALAAGLSHRAIVFRHILPNALTPVLTFFPFSLVGAIGALAALDYLGFGLPPPTASWGELLQQAQQFRWAWWLILYPALALFVVMLLGVFIGEGARNAYDPQPHGRLE